MPIYALLSRFSADAIVEPTELVKLDEMVKRRVRAECADVEWIDSYVLLGRYDSLDLFRAPDNEAASKVAIIIRSFGHVTTEVLPATTWRSFAETLDQVSAATPESEEVEQSAAIEDEVDQAMVESFPASDPPSFTPG